MVSRRLTNTFLKILLGCYLLLNGAYLLANPPPPPPPPAPPTPGSLSVPSTDYDGTVSISWASSSGATGYQLQRNINNGSYVAAYTGSSTSYTNSGLGNGNYDYRVRAYTTGAGGTSYSGWRYNYDLVVTLPPSTPASLSVPATSTSSSVSISWSASSGATSYKVQRNINNGSYSQVYSGSSTSFTNTGLGNGNYDYRVQSCNAAGCSGWRYNYDLVVTLPPGIPSTLTVPSTDTDGSVSVSWSSVSGATSYQLYRRFEGGGYLQVYTGSSTSITDSGLANGTYDYRVRATNSGGSSAYKTNTGLEVYLPPTAPTSLSRPTTDTDGNNISISWVAPFCSYFSNYELYRRKDGGSYSLIYSGTLAVYTDNGLTNGTYDYRVRSCNGPACSDYYTKAGMVVLTPPGAPSSLTVPTSDTDGSVAISWSSSSTATSYLVQRELNESGTWTTEYSGSGTSFTDTGLGNGSYDYRVRASNSSGSSGWTYNNDLTVLHPPGAPSTLNVPSSSASSSIAVSWSSASTATSYLVQRELNESGSWTTEYSGSGTSFTDTGVGNGTYDYRVRATNGSGNSGWTYNNDLTVLLPAPAPASLTVPSADTDGNIPISWSASSGATSYTVERELNESGSWTSEYSGSGTSFTDTGLDSGTYDYRVKASNSAGTSSWVYNNDLVVTLPFIVPTPLSSSLGDPNTVSSTERNNTDKVGSIAGNFRVNESGAATYSIPILAPQGTAGVTPSISLSYSSGSGNGIAGLGWNLGGLSAISRCRQTLQQDDNPLAIEWDASDRFCLDGQRLLLDSGTYGSNGSTYRTEIDSFVKVTAVNGSAGDPSYFKVERKDGSVSYYGNTGDSSSDAGSGKTMTWAINEFEDNVGNNIIFKYIDTPQTDGHMIDQIYWGNGKNTSTTVYNSRIHFEYENRDDDSSGYTAGQLFSSKKRLDYVEVFNKQGSTETELRQYNLYYDESGYGANANDKVSRLTSIQECSGSNCLDKTTFEWMVPAVGASSSVVTENFASTRSSYYRPADINGDGLMDFVYIDTSNRLRYVLADSTSSYSPGTFTNSASYLSLGIASQMEIVDYNADGYQDVLIRCASTTYCSSSGYRYVHLSVPQTDGSWKLSSTKIATGIYDALFGNVFFGDLTSDGLVDSAGDDFYVLSHDTSQSVSSANYYKFIQDTGFGIAGLSTWGEESGSTIDKLGDINGDGIFDIFGSRTGCVYDEENDYCATDNFVAVSKSGLSGNATHDNINEPPGDLAGRVLADFNRDGLSDDLYKDGTSWYYRLSTGTGFTSATSVVSTYTPQVADYNSDGFVDVYWVNTSTNRMYVKYWDPATNAFASQVTVKKGGVDFVTNSSDGFHLWDMNADGLVDLVQLSTSSMKVYYHSDLGDVPNKIVQITNGMGAETDISYEPIGDSDHYAALRLDTSPASTWKESNSVSTSSAFYTETNQDYSASLPSGSDSIDANEAFLRINTGMPVVTEVSSSTPIEGNTSHKSSISYYYADALVQAGGRGFAGFGTLMTVDDQSGVETTTTYRQDWPFIGSPLRTEVKTSTGVMLSEAENTWSARTQSSNFSSGWESTLQSSGSAAIGALAPFIERSVEKSYNPDSSGTVLSTRVTDNTYDGYGNATNVTVRTYAGNQTNPASTSYVSQVATVNTYSDSGVTDAVRLGRLATSTVTTTRKDISPTDTSVRKSTFDYYNSDTTTNPGGVMGGTYYTYEGMLQTEKVFLNSTDSSPLTTTTHYYDTHGNRVMSSALGGSETRYSALATYEGTGRYVDTTHDVFANGSGTATKRLVSDVISRNAYGAPTESRSYVDSTDYITSKSYTTGRGIVYFSTDSTGSWSASNLIDGANGTYCPTGTQYASRTRAAGGGEAYECFDVLGRSIGKAAKGFDGTYAFTKAFYDDVGNVVKTSEPSGSLTASYYTVTSYDDLGRVTSIDGPETGTGDSSSVSYAGLVTTTTNALGHKKKETRNVLGEITRVDEGGTSANMSYATYQYDANGNLTKLTDAASNVTTIVYDNLGRKTSMDDPDKGDWSYNYSAFGELTCQEDANGQIIQNVYDFRGRLIERTDREAGGSCASPSGTVVGYTEWTFDQADNGWGQAGLVEQFTNTSDTIADFKQTSYFEQYGRIERTKTEIEGNSDDHWAKTTYDQYGRVFQSFDAARNGDSYGNNGTTNVYNTHGYLYQITSELFSGTVPEDIYYQIDAMDDRGNVTDATYGELIEVYAGYEADTGFLDWLSSKVGGTGYQNYDLTWDKVGNLTRRSNETGTSGGAGSEIANETEAFVYDGLNRLTSYTVNGTATTVAYNNIGNITSKSDFGGSYTYGTKPSQCNITGAVTPGPHAVSYANGQYYCYDANGNMIKDGSGRDLTYSVYDMVTEITKGSYTTEFEYGPNRSRYRRIDDDGTNTTTTLYLGSVQKVFNDDGTIEWKRDIAGVGQITQVVNTSGTIQSETTHYFLKDHLGSITHQIKMNGSGTVNSVEEMAFDPWGARRNTSDWKADLTASAIEASFFLTDNGITGSPTTTKGYTGHEMVDEMDIIHMNGRIYDARMGRFLQADPHIQEPYATGSLNRYSYVMNNPLNAVDPTGYFFDKLFKGLNKLLGDFAPIIGIALLAIPVVGAWATATWQQAATFGFFTGGVSSGSLKGAAIGAFSGAAFHGIGSKFSASDGFFKAGGAGHIATHGATGGVISVLQGGKFGHGFVSAGFTKAAMTKADFNYFDGSADAVIGRTTIAAVIGGTASELSGGKFANGATTAAMAHLFNRETSAAREREPEAVTIHEDGDDVTIDLRIKFVGDGVTDEVVSRFTGGIEKYWSGSFGSKNVTTNVFLVDEGSYFEITVPAGDGTAYMDSVGSLTGTWPADRPAWTAAHEMGHGMGLPDRYNAAGPLPGYRNNIMGARDKYPSEMDIRNIIKFNE